MPVAITCGLIKSAMEKNGWAEKKYLVDGFPRNEDNYCGWNEVMGDSVNVSCLLHFKASEEVLVERILERGKTSGRTDDNIETIKKRLTQYTSEQVPVIAKFEGQGIVKEIDGLKPVEEVWVDVKQALGDLLI